MEAFSYTDSAGKVWTAPAGSRTDGASIPRLFWTLVGSPFTGHYRTASIIHDYYCNDPLTPRSATDRMFREACFTAGCSEAQADLFYAALRLYAGWKAFTQIFL
jgi:hypothetical protein